MIERTLVWEGCLNVRDLGGHRTESGGVTRYGAVVRADNVRRLSDAGWEALADYGIRTIVDLRRPDECAADPPRELPLTVVQSTLFGGDLAYWERLNDVNDAAPDDTSFVRDAYVGFLADFPENISAAVGAVADADEGGVLVHCMGGKDRTGVVSALVLRVAGVPVEDAAADYALSADNLAPRLQEWLDEAPDEVERRRRVRWSATPADAMAQVLDEVDRRWGGAREYLRAGGLSDEQLDRLAARLV